MKLQIQVGDRPGWKQSVLNIFNTKTKSVSSVRISRKTANQLKAAGVPFEG